MMEISDTISLIGILVANLLVIIAATVKMSNRVSEAAKDSSALRKDFEDHKIDNRDTFNEIKQLLKEDRQLNFGGHEKIMAIVTDVKDKLSEMRIDLLKQDNDNLKKKK